MAMVKPFRLVVARNGMHEEEEEIKYFVSNASLEEPVDHLLLAAFSRWRVERSFQDTKQKLGTKAARTLVWFGIYCYVRWPIIFCRRSGWCVQKKRRVDILSSVSGGGGGVVAVLERGTRSVDERLLSGTQRLGNALPPTNQT